MVSFFAGAARQFAKECLGGITSPLVLLWPHVGRVGEPSTARVLRRDDDRACLGHLQSRLLFPSGGSAGARRMVVTIRAGRTAPPGGLLLTRPLRPVEVGDDPRHLIGPITCIQRRARRIGSTVADGAGVTSEAT